MDNLNFDMSDQIVIVTGGSRGIGRGIAKAFADKGAKVAITYHSNTEAAEAALKDLPGEGHQIFKFDVGNPDSVDEGFGAISKEMGTPTVLVNNAGITKDQILLRLKAEDWNQVMETNLRSVYACTKAAVKVMLKAKKGSIINVTSVIGQTGNAGQSNYAASKAGMIAFTKSVAQEVASRQIRLNCIAPGFIQSDMTDSLTDAQKQGILDRIPLGFIGDAADVAATCLFLASPMARYITGQTVNVNGGLFME